MPALLRSRPSTYGAAMRRALAEEGYGDMPRTACMSLAGWRWARATCR